MDEKEYQKISEELKSATKGVQELVEKQSAEIKTYGETTEKTATQLKKAEERLEAVETEKKELVERLEKMETAMNRPDFGRGDQQVKATPGMQFVASEEFKAARGRKMNSTDAYEVGNLFGLKDVSDILAGDGDDRAPVYSERVPQLFFDPGQRRLTLRDIMNVAQTMSNAIEYFQETSFDEDGAESQTGEGSTKAQLEMSFEKKTATVETIAAWLPASRQVLDDSAQLQGHIDNRLIYAVEKELENQILFGEGTGGELTGIMNTDGIGNIGNRDEAEGAENNLDLIRLAIAQVRASEYEATGIILNPSDWADIELLKGDDNHYIWVNVNDGGTPRLWRVPVVESTVMQEGRFLTGAFGLGAQLWDRMNSTIRISEHHANYFVENAIAVLAELRAALTVYRPRAFVKGTLDTTLST